MYADEAKKVVKQSDGTYTGDAKVIVNKFITALNTAKNKITKERYSPIYSQSVTLDANLCFDPSTLGKSFLAVKQVTDSEGNDVRWQRTANLIQCPDNSSGDALTLEFYYLPADLVNLQDVLDLDPAIIDPRGLCYFAAYFYFKIRNSDKQDSWLELWNDYFDNISSNQGDAMQQDIIF